MKLADLYAFITRHLFKPESPMSLCLFRIAFGLVLLEYCVLTAPEVLTYFSDTNGILRLETLKTVFGIPVIDVLTLLPPGDGWLIAFFAFFSLACVCFTLGLFSRPSSVIVYVGMVSFLHRNIFVHHGGIHLMCIAAFWMMFAPIGAALSLDRLWFKSKSPSESQCSLWAVKAYQFQFALVYWQSSLAKLAAPSWWDGTAMYYVFRHSEFARFPVPIVPQNMVLLKMSTWGALFIEFLGWTFIWFRETRYAVLIALLALHLGIEYAMNIPMFEHIMIASLVLFVPSEDSEKFVTWFKGRLRKRNSSATAAAPASVPTKSADLAHSCT